MFEKLIPTNNMIWFPSLRTIFLILITLVIETGMVVWYAISCGLSSDVILGLAVFIILANLITGLIGWIFQSLRG